MPDAGLAITLPSTWTRLDLDAADISGYLTSRGDTDPAVAQALIAQVETMAPAGLVLFAIGPDLAAGHNLSILRDEAQGMSLDLLENLSLGQLQGVVTGEIATERVDLPAGEAIHFSFVLPMDAAGATTTVDQYLVLTGTHQIALSLAAPTPAEARSIAASLELLDD